jgi:hypothetical protein
MSDDIACPQPVKMDQDLTISCYQNQVPLFVGPALDRLYGNLYSSLEQLKISGKLRNASTYVVSKGEEMLTVLLFRVENGRVEVLNEVIRVDESDINRFTRYIFERFPAVKLVSFRAIQTEVSELPFMHQRFNYLEDFVIDLPKDEAGYGVELGKKAHRNIRRYQKILNQDFDSFRFEVYEGAAADEQLVRQIVALNKARMSGKNKVSSLDEAQTARIVQMVRECGLVGAISIDGKICAGAISYRVGQNYFLGVLAHNPAYNKYGLGILCCYLTICECIARCGKEFHFLWGRYSYKHLLAGVRRDLDYLVIYRSALQYALHYDIAFKALINARKRQAMLWLHEAKHRDNFAARMAVKLLPYLRSFKQMRLFYAR